MNDFQDFADLISSDDKLDNIDSEYYYEGIASQIDELLQNTSKKNYLKKFEKKIEENYDYDDEIENAKEQVYTKIVEMITDKFDFEVDDTQIKLSILTKNLYKFFVLDYIDNLTYFLESYIIENKVDIIKNIETFSNMQNKRIEGVDSKTSIILNNIADVITIIAGDDLTFREYVEYINKHPESSAAVSAMLEYDEEILSETDGIYRKIMQDLLDEEEGFSNIYTKLQLNIFDRFKSEDF